MRNLQLRKQIYRKMYIITIISVALTALLLVVSFYNFFNIQMQNDVKARTEFFKRSLNYSADNLDYISSLNLTEGDARLSIIAADGSVSYDSYKDSSYMENHLDRPEIIQAFKYGYSEERRFSSTLGEETFYCATILSDGTVLRLAQTTSSIYSVFIKVLPLILLCTLLIFILANVIAVKVTKRIVEPINSLDLEQPDIPVYDELAPFIRTILNQKELIKNQLAVVENYATTITAITKSMSEGLLILDNHGMIISVNNSALDIFSVQGDFIGKHVLEFTRNTEIIDSINHAIAGKSIHDVLTVENHFYAMIASPVSQNEELIGAIVLFLDVTDKHNAEQQRREFSANVSHELKTPLTTISGYAEMISTGMVQTPDIPAFSGKIKDESSRLLNLIEDIIRLSELDESNGKHQFSEFDLTELAHTVAESLEQTASKRSVTLNVMGAPVMVTANMRMVDELIYNLIDNAIKYNKPCGVVDIDITVDHANACIAVCDSGIGIAKADQERVFERFYRVDRSRSKKTGGTGLGLAIVKHIVAYHDGTINMSSEEGIGTTIDVLIPLVKM